MSEIEKFKDEQREAREKRFMEAVGFVAGDRGVTKEFIIRRTTEHAERKGVTPEDALKSLFAYDIKAVDSVRRTSAAQEAHANYRPESRSASIGGVPHPEAVENLKKAESLKEAAAAWTGHGGPDDSE